MASVDLHTASFIAALIKALDTEYQGFSKLLEECERNLTVDELADALAIVHRCRYSEPDDVLRTKSQLRREAEVFLANR